MGNLVGNLLGQVFQRLFGNREVRVLMLGLDNAGKTSILMRLRSGEVVTTTPTIGLNMEVLVYKNVQFSVWDLGGQTAIRPYWRYYYTDTQALIFVVDSCDQKRLETSKKELQQLLLEEELANAVVVVFSNKSDLPDSLPPDRISEGLGLPAIKNRPWAIFKTSAITGTGLYDGLDWLATSLAEGK